MLRVELVNVVKYYQDRLILKIDELRLYDREVIGIVGCNGSGKTTLLNIISGQLAPDEGTVKVNGDFSYITQYDCPGLRLMQLDPAAAGRFKLSDSWEPSLSGGENTRFKLAAAFSKNGAIILADEPTANLDLAGIQLLEESLKQYPGTVLLVSHDRELLDKLCDRILELEDGQAKLYPGNYTSYVEQKEQERKRQKFEYQQFIREKTRLKDALVEVREKSRSVRKTPGRMGNSEARLHKMGNQRAKANLDQTAKALKSRMAMLGPKEKPKQFAAVKFDLTAGELYSKVILEGKNLNKSFGDKIIFANAGFQLRNGEKTALVGENGSGKTTLIKMLLNGEAGITASRAVRIGYFSQELDILDERKNIIENLLESSKYDEAFVRTILARLLFRRDDIYKKVSVLSGGEKVRASFGKIILSDCNLLILDEPTNYLDIYSLEAVEKVLTEYPGNLLFVSHDRRFVDNVASSLLIIKDKGLISFPGNYTQYILKESAKGEQQGQEQRMLLECRLSELVGRLAAPTANDDLEQLDSEYKQVAARLKELK